MHDVYGADLGDRALDSRSWRWFKVRLFGLLNRPPLLGEWTTRLQTALYPPPAAGQANLG